MHFTKMQGLGNDYLYVYGPIPPQIRELCARLSDRHFGVGADGMIFIFPSEEGDFEMRIFNADGSEGKMCGNGIRCVGKYLYDKGYTDRTHLEINTRSGVKHLHLHLMGGKVKSVTVEMGEASVGQEMSLNVEGTQLRLIPVSVGNPHGVVFVERLEEAPLTTLGPKVERHPAFPEGVNVEFVQVLSPCQLRMRVWERGSGVTMACGTGACASAAAAAAQGLCRKDAPISVQLDGGTLEIQVASDGMVTMTGPAETVYEGEVEL